MNKMEPVAPEDAPQQQFQHPPVLENETPGVLTQTYATGVQFLQLYGWYLILGVLLLYYIKHKLSPYFQQQQQRWETARDYKKYDPEVTRQRQEAMDNARRRLQEQHEAKAAKFAEEQAKKDEEKRKAKIEDWNRHQEGKGYRSKVKVTEEETAAASAAALAAKARKKVYKSPDYSPLSGEMSGASFRPPRRGGAGGGG